MINFEILGIFKHDKATMHSNICSHSFSLSPSLLLRLEELRVEYDEFQENSHDLEAELEASLEQTEAKNKDLQARLQRLEDENESMRVSPHMCVCVCFQT